MALLCDANVAVSPCHFVARHGESAEGCNWPQSDSFAGWPNSEGCVACSARKPSAVPTVKAIAASRAKRSLIRIRREACRRGRPARAGRPHQMPHRLVGISDQTACGSLSLGEQTTAGNDVARTGPRGDSFAYSFRFAGPLGGGSPTNRYNSSSAHDKWPGEIKRNKAGHLRFDRPMTSTQRYRRWYARRRFEKFPWGTPA